MSQAGISSISGVIGIPIMVSNGGTGRSSFIPYSVITGGTTSTSPLQSVATVGTSGQVLTSSGAGALPTWTTLPTPVTSVSGTLNRITSTGGSTPVIDISASYVGQTSISTLGTITTGVWNGSIVDLAHGGTNANLTADNGGVVYSTATALAIVPHTATANQPLLSGASGAPGWSTATYPGSTTINQILYSSANNTVTGLATANNGVLIASNGGVPSMLAAGTTGQVLTATTGAPPSWVSPASGQISVVTGQKFTASGAFTYTPTASMKYVIVELVGGGGGSGGCAISVVTPCASGGGGGGGYAKFILTAAQVGASLAGSVGVGGTAGSSGNNAGGNGGNTTLATTSAWTVGGGVGSGGGSAASVPTNSSGGAGGTVTTGTGTILNNNVGTAGDDGFGITGLACSGGGGSSGLGKGAPRLTVISGTSVGVAGVHYGAGASGSSGISNANTAGSAGAIGVAIFTEFC